MKNIKYYLDKDNNVLSAYDRETDFFAQFVQTKKQWQQSGISFVRFRHDYNYTQISAEEAAKLSDGITPDALFDEFVAAVAANRNPF